MKKKVLSLLVTFAMLFSMLPATALAAGPDMNSDVIDVDASNAQDVLDGKYGNVGDRAIRLNAVSGDAEISVNNNIMVNCGDEDGQLIKAGNVDEAATIDLESNYWDGEDVATAVPGLTAPSTVGITGGTWDDDVSAYLAAGYEMNESGEVIVDESAFAAKVGTKYFNDLQDAIIEAAPAGTVEILNDVVVDEWVMITESLTIGNDQLITLDSIDGLTIDGNNHTLTINSIESASNGNRLFYDATNLNIQDLTIKYEGNFGGIGLTSGTISNVTFMGGTQGVFPGEGDVTITGCTFKTNSTAIYYEVPRDNLVVNGNTFQLPDDTNVIIMYGAEEFTNNTVVSGRTVNVAGGSSATVTGNDFGDVRFKVYNTATATIVDNTINVLEFSDETAEVCSSFAENTLSEAAQAELDAAKWAAPSSENPVIGNLAQLKAFRDAVNAGNNYQGVTVKLAADIDLNSEEWTPIGTSSAPFNGTFDGDGHTISNLVITGSNSNVGLFGYTTNGEIKNLTVENALVSGRLNVGVVAGTPYTSKYTNIKVTGHVEVNGMAYVGGVGGKNAYANWTDITVDVDDTSYVKATSTESGTAYRTYVGGVVGFNGEGSHTFKNISSNIDVIGDVCDVGGVFGIAHYSNKFENIACSGDVINSNSSDPLEETETGGICGVWHNQAGTSVSFDDCEFTGTVTVNGVVVTSNNLTGGAYNPNNDESSTSGSLIVDGEKQWPLVAEVNGVQYGTMSAAIASAGADDVVTLLNDAVEVVEINNGGTTVDLGGHTLSGSILIKDGEFEIKNGSIVNSDASVSGIEINAGALTLTDVNVTSARHALRVDGSATVTVDGGKYIVSESAGKTTHAVNVSGGGSVTIKDGAFTGPRGMVNDSGAAVTVQADSTVIITGGSFSGGKNNTLSSKGSLIVAGGAFDQDPSAYLATGYYSYRSPSNSMYYVNLDDGFDAVAETNGVKHQTLEAAVNAAKDGGTVVILKGGNYSVPTGKNLTITGAVEDVKFDMSQAVNMSGASVTFNNVTFEYGSSDYVGLKHAGTMVYNDCTINGQVFLYGTSETFNDCTFNQSSADAYNVWTYGAQKVNFNDCEFNSAGKSVLVYNEGACATDLTLVNTKFIASAPVEGKAAIEIDTTLMPDGTDIVIDAATTATGFDKGSISGEELWNDKKDQTDLTVTVNDEKVWPKGKAVIDHGFQTIINSSKPRESITTTLKNVYASESLVLKIYSGETLLGTTTLREYEDGDTSKPMYPAIRSEYTVNNVITGVESGSWETMWDVELTRKNVPTKIKVYADGVLTDTYEDTNGCFLNDEEKAKYIELFDLTFTVTFDTNGGSSVDAQEIVSGELATRPATAPTKSGHAFVNWYSDEALTSVFDFSAPITADTTVYAKWNRNSSGGGGGGSTSYTIAVEDTKNGDITVSPSRASSGSTVTITVDPDSGYELDELTVLDKNGKEIKLTKKSDSKYTFKMPSGKVTIEATFAEIEAFENPFTDVAEGAYYYDAVLWAAENGITGGTSATTFSPAVTCTRAQTVTFLWRAAGSPDPEGTNMPFTDVASDAYYYDAVLWAVENGITSGTSATTFSPNATVTRAQNVTFLWRWAESSAVEAVNPFTDVAADMYYHGAVLWAAEEGITAGTSATTFSPDDPCLRSQIVTFLYRYLAK